ncbi:MAG TPA: hypothetical protein PLS93_02340 [Accumulibacter sp.]|nr:hypothetical protein [Accumulibacter sp.]
MGEHYLVRCTASSGRTMAGIYAAGLTATGIIATWKQERAARYESKTAADGVASRLARRFSGTAWEVSHAT